MHKKLRLAKVGECPAGIDGSSNILLFGEDGLIAVLKDADCAQQAKLRRLRIPMIHLTVCFFLLTWLSPESANGEQQQLKSAGFACICAFVSILFGIKLKALSRIDYSKPVKTFLAEAEVRYRFIRVADWFLIVFCFLLMGTVFGIGQIPYLSMLLHCSDPYIPMAVHIASYMLILALGLYVKKLEWKQDRALLWRQIQEARQQINSQD